MCGIAVILHRHPAELVAIRAMTDALFHRGPDESGYATLEEDGVALGMRRLSIVDIAEGQQPMWDEDRRHCVVFNGEIYNAADLRAQLVQLGHRFRTDHSDTEVLVHGFEEWRGDLFRRLDGMFAVAIWDRLEKALTLARDRCGEKPLFIARLPRGYAVASELKALLCIDSLDRTIDREALEQYLAFDYTLAPLTMFKSVQKLPAGHIAVITHDRLNTAPYWTPSVARNGRIREEDLLEELDDLLEGSVRRRMVADVPVGLFLSGGLDSTTIGYYMTQQGGDVQSFSIGFEESAFDESRYASLAATALGTTHHQEILSQRRALELIEQVPEILDEPMGDQSILPTYLLSRFTRTGVKVALGGDGSDELLMGYNAYRPLKVAWSMDVVPRSLRAGVASAARAVPGAGVRLKRPIALASRLDSTPAGRLLSHLGGFKGDARWVLTRDSRMNLPAAPLTVATSTLMRGVTASSGADLTVLAYLRGYLQEDILVKVDRASMAASLEVRAPFLDPKLVDFLLRISPSDRLRGFTGKWALRKLMRGRIPDITLDRPKVGFGVPLSAWLRDSLAPMVRELLSPEAIRRAGLFDPAAVSRLVDEHLSGRHDHGQKIWLLLQFELWRVRWRAV